MAHSASVPKLMLVTRDRVFYQGYLGLNMKPRRQGATLIVSALQGDIHLRRDHGAWERRKIVAIPTGQIHELRSDSPMVSSVWIETERADTRNLSRLCQQINSGSCDHDLPARMHYAAQRLKSWSGRPVLTSDDFDEMFLGSPIGQRQLDARIDYVLDIMDNHPGEASMRAENFASCVSLSRSRFLHLFKDETGITFRNLRVWKRARRFVEYVAHDGNLTGLALDLGYNDSSHFCHSIRSIYGLLPSHIRDGARNLNVIRITKQSKDAPDLHWRSHRTTGAWQGSDTPELMDLS